MALVHIGTFSRALGMCVSLDVILPQRARNVIGMKSEAGTERMPVLWLLHGMSDNHTIWQRRTNIERYVAPLGMAVVMPNAHLSSYADMAHGGRYFSYIADELPGMMRGFFPFSDKRADNYVCGLSMGGAGAMKIGLARPENYAAIGCLSAAANNRVPGRAMDERTTARMQMLYGNRALDGTEEDVLGNAKRIVETGRPCPRVYHACGKDDFLLPAAHITRDFFQGLAGNPFNYVYEEDEGAHSWEYWDEHIQHFLRFITQKRV